MTPSSAIQKVYSWSLDTSANKKSSIMQLYCARQCQMVIDSNESYEDRLEKLKGLLREWARRVRSGSGCQGLKNSLRSVARMMAIDIEQFDAEDLQAAQ
jgi:hypothetical protein